jgi:hypothetical protein
MLYRFQIVASAHHKGRLKVVYDPSYPLTNEYNTNYTYVIDLAKERDFTVRVGWGHEKSFLNHRTPIQDSIPFSTQKLAADPRNFANGILSVYVVNDLTVPNSTVNNDISVNVFVSAGEDFEVCDPDSTTIRDLVWFEPQMGEVFSPQMAEVSASHPDADLTKSEDEPMKMTPSQIMAPTLSNVDHTLDVYFGDPVVSFRQCLKRYNFHSAIVPQGSDSLAVFIKITRPNFPYYRGYCPGAINLTSVPVQDTDYNYSKTTLLNYLTPAYVCRRGGMRWKYFTNGSVNFPDTFPLIISRTPGGGEFYTQDTNPITSPTVSDESFRVREMNEYMPLMWDGAIATSTSQNPVVEAEIPYYENVRFTQRVRPIIHLAVKAFVHFMILEPS